MKKLFTIDDIVIAFISALGYGFGETLARLSGWPNLVCYGVSFVFGMVLEEIISRIVFSKTVQKKTTNRILIYAVVFFVFLTAHYISVRWLGVSMVNYLLWEVAFVIVLPILGFVVYIIVRKIRAGKIQGIYGDGSEGYVFDVDHKDIEEINQQNQAISGVCDADCAVKTKTGIYVGEKQKKTISYLGIPYAMPPIGERRWKAPEPLPPSEAVFEAVNFGASAIQVEHKGAILKHHRQSEDCLSLNICVSRETTEEKKPVLVLFHHGDFSFGGSADPLLYGDHFTEGHPDIVFVSFNYRLGIFGFIDFSEVPGGEAYPDALNLGLLDQIAALKWIKENIAAFGGDPDRITVIGFESGATSICLLAASGQARGLFRKAFIFNGNPETAYDSTEASKALAERLLKETGTGTMEELIQLKTETLKDAAQKLWKSMCAPTCDGTWIPADICGAYRNGAASGIEFIIGLPSHEMQVLRSFIGRQNYEDLISAALADIKKETDGPVSDMVEKITGTRTGSPTSPDEKSTLIEQWNALCIYRSAAALSQGGNKVHALYWDEKPLIGNLGSGTVDAAATLLGNGDALQIYGNVMDEDLSEILQRLLQKYVSGNALQLYPNEIKGVDALNWKAFPEVLTVSDGKINVQ